MEEKKEIGDSMNCLKEVNILSSSESARISLEAIRKGEAGLNERRRKL